VEIIDVSSDLRTYDDDDDPNYDLFKDRCSTVTWMILFCIVG